MGMRCESVGEGVGSKCGCCDHAKGDTYDLFTPCCFVFVINREGGSVRVIVLDIRMWRRLAVL